MKRMIMGCWLVLALLPSLATADEVIMSNGDRLTGTLLEAKGGKLFFQTPYADRAELRFADVVTVQTDAPVRLRMEDREVLNGRLATVDGEIRLLPTETRGKVVIAWDRVQSINVPDRAWLGNVHLGGTQQVGNTDRMSTTVGADAIRRSLDDRLSFSFLFNYAEEDEELTTRDVYGAMKYDYFFRPEFYGLVSMELLHDRFRDLNLRTTAGPGVGYQIFEDARKALALEAGIAYVAEDRIEADDDRWFTARLALIFRYEFTDWVRFSDTFIIYPELVDVGEYTYRNEAALITALASNWSLRLSNLWERDSHPPSGVNTDDLRTSLSVQYTF